MRGPLLLCFCVCVGLALGSLFAGVSTSACVRRARGEGETLPDLLWSRTLRRTKRPRRIIPCCDIMTTRVYDDPQDHLK